MATRDLCPLSLISLHLFSFLPPFLQDGSIALESKTASLFLSLFYMLSIGYYIIILKVIIMFPSQKEVGTAPSG